MKRTEYNDEYNEDGNTSSFKPQDLLVVVGHNVGIFKPTAEPEYKIICTPAKESGRREVAPFGGRTAVILTVCTLPQASERKGFEALYIKTSLSLPFTSPYISYEYVSRCV